MTPGIFVTGTNTGVGKTVVTAAMLRLLRQRGVRAVGLKPVASGADRDGARRPSAQCRRRWNCRPPPRCRCLIEQVNPYCFEPAIAPHIAAEEAGEPVGAGDLVEWYQRATRGADLALVEGAGGWRVPLHPEGFLSDLPESLELGVILVVGLTLGCLNHARLTAEAIHAAGRCRLLGWIAQRDRPSLRAARREPGDPGASARRARRSP